MHIMGSTPKPPFDAFESPQGPDVDVFDPDPVDEDDLWFLPASDHASLDAAHDLPLPRADRRPLVDVAAWGDAQAKLARPLTDLGISLGGLAARLAAGPTGWQHHIALQEAVDLSWLAGDRVPAERLALWLALRLAGDHDDAQALARAGWVVRRLMAGHLPADDLALFLGRQSEELQTRLDDQIADWAEVMGQARGLHSITQAALSFHIWPIVALSSAGGMALPLIEAATVAARHAASDVKGLPFLPLALGGAGGLRGHGTTYERLERWIAGADHAARAAVRLLDRLQAWEAQALTRCASLSGRTPPQLIRLLRDWPLVSAPMAEAEIDASRTAIQRNLNWMADQGLIRETTGQGRYRFWTAAV